MKEIDPQTALTDTAVERERRRDRAVEALEWFRGRNGLVARGDAVAALSETHEWSEAVANRAVADLVGDLVDPVQQVVHPERGKLVGIIEHHEYPDSGAYGYVDYDDVEGKRKRVVCSQCVKTAESDTEVAHATVGEGSVSETATWEELRETVEEHYKDAHSVDPSGVEVGASLASGTTISGSKSFHAGNDGVGSGLDADLLQGSSPSDIGSTPPVYGTGSDGNIFDGSNRSRSGILHTENYTVQSGATVNVSPPGVLIVHAQQEIRVDGTITATGAGGAGGAGGSPGATESGSFNPGGDGQDGEPGVLFGASGSGGSGGPARTAGGSGSNGGGAGGTGAFGSATGGQGGDSPQDTAGFGSPFRALSAFNSPAYASVYKLVAVGAGGGGGGGGAADEDTSRPAGGGGDGGDGGGCVLLIAPKITGSGAVRANGTSGGRGGDAGNDDDPNDGPGGGGGGGDGGGVILAGASVTYNGSLSATGGAGGGGGTTNEFPEDGATGSDGADGVELIIDS